VKLLSSGAGQTVAVNLFSANIVEIGFKGKITPKICLKKFKIAS
jgi:hypothetical protein